MRTMIREVTVATVALVVGQRVVVAQSPSPPPSTWRTERLTPRLYLLTGSDDGNILVYVGRKALTLVDAGELTSAPATRSAVRAISGLPVRTVIITHYHSDHLGGAGQWHRAGAEIVAQENVARQALKDTVIVEFKWHRTPAERDALPTRTFRDSLMLGDRDERIEVVHVDSAHTDGDAMVWFPKADVIHAGDVLSTPPGIDIWVGGSVDGLIRGFDRLLAMAGPHTRIVPGHGAVTTRDFVIQYRAMMGALRDTVNAAVARGDTRDQLVASGSASRYADLLGGERIAPQILSLLYRARLRQLAPRSNAPAGE